MDGVLRTTAHGIAGLSFVLSFMPMSEGHTHSLSVNEGFGNHLDRN